MIEALRSQGKTCESIFFANEDHGFRYEKNLIQEFRAVGEFLKKNLPPDPRPAGG